MTTLLFGIRKLIGGKTNTAILVFVLWTLWIWIDKNAWSNFDMWYKVTLIIGSFISASFLERVEKYKGVIKAILGMIDDIGWIPFVSKKGKELKHEG
jgi:hypothetical protein